LHEPRGTTHSCNHLAGLLEASEPPARRGPPVGPFFFCEARPWIPELRKAPYMSLSFRKPFFPFSKPHPVSHRYPGAQTGLRNFFFFLFSPPLGPSFRTPEDAIRSPSRAPSGVFLPSARARIPSSSFGSTLGRRQRFPSTVFLTLIEARQFFPTRARPCGNAAVPPRPLPFCLHDPQSPGPSAFFFYE